MISVVFPAVCNFAAFVLPAVVTFDTAFFVEFPLIFLAGLIVLALGFVFAVAAFFLFTDVGFVESHSPSFASVCRNVLCFAAFVTFDAATFVSSRKGSRTTNFGLVDDNMFGPSSPRTK